jgi:N utilization substance protein A
VVSQKLKEAERGLIYEEYHNKVGQVLTGKVQRVERGHVYVEFAKTEAVLPPKEQIPGEVFRTNDRIKCYIQEVKRRQRGRRSSFRAPHRSLSKSFSNRQSRKSLTESSR